VEAEETPDCDACQQRLAEAAQDIDLIEVEIDETSACEPCQQRLAEVAQDVDLIEVEAEETPDCDACQQRLAEAAQEIELIEEEAQSIPCDACQQRLTEAARDIELMINRTPEAFPDTYTLKQHKELNVKKPGVLSNDHDPDEEDILIAALVNEPASGTLKFDKNGSFTYHPKGDTTGAVTFTYKVKDHAETWSNIATVTIIIEKTAMERSRQKDTITRMRRMSQGAVNNQANRSDSNTLGVRDDPAQDQPRPVPVTITIERED
jgi:cytidine deaminase